MSFAGDDLTALNADHEFAFPDPVTVWYMVHGEDGVAGVGNTCLVAGTGRTERQGTGSGGAGERDGSR